MPAPRRKLIEVDIPLDAINRESAREKSTSWKGHPTNIHIWWARRPISACRAIIFASMVDDPSSYRHELPDEDGAESAERLRLHRIIERLVIWEATDESQPEARALLDEARYEIARSVARSREEDPPDKDAPDAVLRYLGEAALPIYDPFAGGGSIPLEAQRLGLHAIASDLNPVAVLINKALIEIPPKFAAKPPVNPGADRKGMKTGKMIGRGKNKRPEMVAWRGAVGLADDIRYYGRKMREMAFERIGHLYPKAKLPNGSQATVVAWLWARTVPCPNPVCRADMPLTTTFQVSKKANNRRWTKPVVNRDTNEISFVVQETNDGIPMNQTVVRGGKGATCLTCNGVVRHSYIREQSKKMGGNMGEKMIAIVAEGDRKRTFVSPTAEHEKIAKNANPNESSIPSQKMPPTAYLVSGRGYGITHWRQLFTKRQLAALATFSDLIPEVRALIIEHGASNEYADAICTYLALAIGRTASGNCSFTRWRNDLHSVEGAFGRQAIPMVWNFAEPNLFSNSTQNWLGQVEWVAQSVERLPTSVNTAQANQADATTTIYANSGPVIVTDPPYYDNISFAELSDFFYVWLRLTLREIYPDLFAGMLVPIQEEMIAAPRFGDNAKQRFEYLMNKTLRLIRERGSPEFPSSIFYAYKQQEESRDGTTSTGWETMLTALVNAGFRIIGTWPMRTEKLNRPNAFGANTLASSVVLVCRPRPEDAPMASRRQFIADLKREMPARLAQLDSVVAPADREQSAIGPGMEIYSRYSRVETLDGRPVSVGEALALINNSIQEYDDQEEGGFDPETRFCMAWLKQFGWGDGKYGVAQDWARTKNVVIERLRDDHRLLTAGGGVVRLRPPDAYAPDGEAGAHIPSTAWAAYHRMAWHFGSHPDAQRHAGAASTARDISADLFDSVRRLEQALYAYYDRRGDARQARQFNALGAEWDRITIEKDKPAPEGEQTHMLRR